MTPLAAIPLTLIVVVLVGTALVRALVPRLPGDVELACGLGVGTGAISAVAFVLSALHLPSRLAAVVALACAIAVTAAVGGRPRLPGPRARRLLAPVAWFGVASLGLILLQPVPRGVWNFDWALHYMGDVHYADAKGIGDPELGFGWSVLSRPPLFNLARLPAELILERSYATAEAATVVIALVLPAGAWLFLREVASPRRASGALWLVAASGYWVHLGANPKPIALATGLALSCIGIVLRSRRRSAPGLVPLAALLAALAGLAHPVAGLGLVPVGIAALRAANARERVASLLIVLAVSLPWPLWANHVTGGNLLAHDPVRRFSQHSPLGEGLVSVTNMGWNVVASAVPFPIVGHATALATGLARPTRDAEIEVFLEAEVSEAVGAVGFVLLVALLVARPRAPPFASPRLAGLEVALFAALVLFAAERVFSVTGIGPAPMRHGASVPVDNRLVSPLLLVAGLALAGVAVAIARRPSGGARRTADLLLATLVVQCAAGLLLHEKAEYSGVAHNALTPAVAILAFSSWTLVTRRPLGAMAAFEGLSVLLVLGLGAFFDFLPPDRQVDFGFFLGLTSLHDSLGRASIVGAPLLAVAALMSARGFARSSLRALA